MSDDEIRVVVPRDIMTKPADGRGRVTLGPEYADEIVTVGVLWVDD